jgi:ankyrin repeat protein
MTLCQDRESSEPELISQLKSVPRTNYVLAERDSVGWTLLKAAAVKRSVELIKELLVETDGGLDCVRATDGVESLHTACYNGNIEAVKYLYTIYSEGINIASDHGKYPLHFALDHNGRARDDRENLTRFLLQHDQGAVSKPAFDGDLALHFDSIPVAA